MSVSFTLGRNTRFDQKGMFYELLERLFWHILIYGTTAHKLKRPDKMLYCRTVKICCFTKNRVFALFFKK